MAAAVVNVASPRPHPLATPESLQQLRSNRSVNPGNGLWDAIQGIPMKMEVALDTWLKLIESGEVAPMLRPIIETETKRELDNEKEAAHA